MDAQLRKVMVLTLDRKLRKFKPLMSIERPRRGWAKAIRDALGMTAAQLARRLGVKTPRIFEIEKGETTGSVTLATMDRIAKAMGCRFVYGLVPVEEASLEQMRQNRARMIAQEKLDRVDHTMALEDQAANDRKQPARRAELVEWLLQNDRQLWEDNESKTSPPT